MIITLGVCSHLVVSEIFVATKWVAQDVSTIPAAYKLGSDYYYCPPIEEIYTILSLSKKSTSISGVHA